MHCVRAEQPHCAAARPAITTPCRARFYATHLPPSSRVALHAAPTSRSSLASTLSSVPSEQLPLQQQPGKAAGTAPTAASHVHAAADGQPAEHGAAASAAGSAAGLFCPYLVESLERAGSHAVGLGLPMWVLVTVFVLLSGGHAALHACMQHRHAQTACLHRNACCWHPPQARSAGRRGCCWCSRARCCSCSTAACCSQCA